MKERKDISPEMLARYLNGTAGEEASRLVEQLLASDELSLRAAILISREKALRQMRRRHYITLAAIVAVLMAVAFAFHYFAPVNTKVNLQEDSVSRIEGLPFEKGEITCQYGDHQPHCYPIYGNSPSIVLDEVSRSDKDIHIVFQADGYQSIDTVVNVQRNVNLNIKRNNDLGLVFGTIIDAETALPLCNAEITIQDLRATTDSSGRFSIEIPFTKQAEIQQIQVSKPGYQNWTGTFRPSQVHPWNIALEKSWQ